MSSTAATPTRELARVAFFGAAAVVFTFPMAFAPERAISLHPDTLKALWNFWWLPKALFELQTNPFYSDYLHTPDGFSLARHVLSPANALIGGSLAAAIGGHGAFKVLTFLHFWWSGWVFDRFVRELGGSRNGSLLAGLCFTASPFHYYYLPQINLSALEVLPLVMLFVVRCYRGHGRSSMLGVVGSSALCAATSSYYTVYAGMLAGLLLVSGRWWSPETRVRDGVRRLAVAGVAAGFAVAAVNAPLLLESFANDTGIHLQPERSNDLLGFAWVLVPEIVLVSWPTMIGYGVLAVILLGARRGRAFEFWLATALIFFVLSLGPSLRIGGDDTGFPLPYAALAELPVLAMLRKPDRIFIVTQLALGVLFAFSWREIFERSDRSAWRRRSAWATAGLILIERAALPLASFETQLPSIYAELARLDDADSLVDLPVYGGGHRDARSNVYQTLHEKKIPQGYVTSYALPERHVQRARVWNRTLHELEAGDSRGLLFYARSQGVDLLVLHRLIPRYREKTQLHGAEIWAPFALAPRELVRLRQLGHIEESLADPELFEASVRTLREELGAPVAEDALRVVFRVP